MAISRHRRNIFSFFFVDLIVPSRSIAIHSFIRSFAHQLFLVVPSQMRIMNYLSKVQFKIFVLSFHILIILYRAMPQICKTCNNIRMHYSITVRQKSALNLQWDLMISCTSYEAPFPAKTKWTQEMLIVI